MTAEPLLAFELMQSNPEVAKLPRAEATRLVHAALDLRHPAPEWFVAREVLCSDYRLDAVVVRMWAQAVLHVFEVKASRADWLREIKHPRKAEAALPFADHFWLAIAEKGVVRLEEVPDSWGLVVLQSNGQLRAAKAAPLLRPHVEGRVFWASMIRRAFQGSEERDVEELLRQEYQKGYRAGNDYGRTEAARAFEHDARMIEDARQIREAFGWDLSTLVHRAPELRAALQEGDFRRRVGHLARELRRLADEIEARTTE